MLNLERKFSTDSMEVDTGDNVPLTKLSAIVRLFVFNEQKCLKANFGVKSVDFSRTCMLVDNTSCPTFSAFNTLGNSVNSLHCNFYFA